MSVMWTLFKQSNGIITQIATWSQNVNDNFDIRLSMFRGPNILIWYSYEPSTKLLLGTNIKDQFIIAINDRGKVLWDIQCTLTYIGWNNKKGCMELRFEPSLLYYLNTRREIYFSDVKTLDGFIKTIVPSTFDYSVSSDIKDFQIFSNLSIKGKPFDVICDMAADYGLEVYCTGRSLAIGYIKSQDINPLLMSNATWFNNSVGVYEIYGTKFANITTKSPFYIPGGYIKVNNSIKRIIYNRIYIGPVKDSDQYKVSTEEIVAAENTIIAVDNNKKITEEMLYHAIPEEDRVYMHHINPFKYSSLVSVTKEESDTTKKVYPNSINDDLTNIVAVKGETLDVVKASPYAGDEVGLQFPHQEESIDLVSFHKEKYHAGVAHSQLWSDKIPIKNNPEDFRLTLPDGGNVYYDNAKGKWIFAAKSQIVIGIDSGASYTSVSFDSESGKIIITDGTRTITMDGSTVNVT